MKNILKIVPLILLTVFLSSCTDDDKVSYPDIKGIQEEVMIVEGETADFELSGGDKKFIAESSDSSVASVKVKDNMLMITAVKAGMTEITIKSADKMKVVKVKVKEAPVSYPEIGGIAEEIMLIKGESVKFELSGGDKKFTAESGDSNVANVKVEDGMLMIMAEATGMVDITIKSADKMKVVKIKVMETPEKGIYMGFEQKMTFKNSVTSNEGMWLVEVAGSPYDGKRVFVPSLPQNLERNQEIEMGMMAFGVDGMEENMSKAMVEAVTNDIVKLKVGEYSIVIPRDK